MIRFSERFVMSSRLSASRYDPRIRVPPFPAGITPSPHPRALPALSPGSLPRPAALRATTEGEGDPTRRKSSKPGSEGRPVVALPVPGNDYDYEGGGGGYDDYGMPGEPSFMSFLCI